MMSRHYADTKELYLAYAELYTEHPDFRKQLEEFHTSLPAFIAEAMRVYAHHELT